MPAASFGTGRCERECTIPIVMRPGSVLACIASTIPLSVQPGLLRSLRRVIANYIWRGFVFMSNVEHCSSFGVTGPSDIACRLP